MSRIVIFGAGGNGGRAAVAEAVGRGHEVVAVVRDPAKYADLAGDRVTVVRGDVTEADSVRAVAHGADAAISSVYTADVEAETFYVAAATALVGGLEAAGVGRLVVIGIGSLLEAEPGVRIVDAPDFPDAWRTFTLGHGAEVDVLRRAASLDWLVVAPPMVLDAGPRAGTYRVGGNQLLTLPDGTSHLSYADLAIAMVDEIETPKHHRTMISVAD